MRSFDAEEFARDTAPALALAAVRAGELVQLTVQGTPIADVVPHVTRPRWLSGREFHYELTTRSADTGLRSLLDDAAPGV